MKSTISLAGMMASTGLTRKELYIKTANGEARFNHKNCPAGTDRRRRLYITKTYKGFVWHCFNCGGSGGATFSDDLLQSPALNNHYLIKTDKRLSDNNSKSDNKLSYSSIMQAYKKLEDLELIPLGDLMQLTPEARAYIQRLKKMGNLKQVLEAPDNMGIKYSIKYNRIFIPNYTTIISADMVDLAAPTVDTESYMPLVDHKYSPVQTHYKFCRLQSTDAEYASYYWGLSFKNRKHGIKLLFPVMSGASLRRVTDSQYSPKYLNFKLFPSDVLGVNPFYETSSKLLRNREPANRVLVFVEDELSAYALRMSGVSTYVLHGSAVPDRALVKLALSKWWDKYIVWLDNDNRQVRMNAAKIHSTLQACVGSTPHTSVGMVRRTVEPKHLIQSEIDNFIHEALEIYDV